MAFIAKTHFDVKVTNAEHNSLQNIAGKYGSFSVDTFTAADCSPGTLVVKKRLIASEGYGSLSTPVFNGNAWYVVDAANGNAGSGVGTHSGIYACNNYDVNKVGAGELQYNLGIDTLGVGTLAGNMGDFTELLVGEQYCFGLGNFASAPTVGQYCAIANGKFGASSGSAPVAGSGYYAKVLRTVPLNVGTGFYGTGYIVTILRAADVAG